MFDLVWICVIVGLIGAGVVGYFVRYVLRQDQGSEKIREISHVKYKEKRLSYYQQECVDESLAVRFE